MRTVLAYHLRWLIASRSLLATVLLAGLAVALAGLIALHDLSEQALAASAILWLIATVAGLLASSRVLEAEAGEGGLQGLLLAPLQRRDLFLARSVATVLLVLLLTLLSWGLLIPFFPTLSALRGPALLPVIVVGSTGLGLLGTLSAWASLSARSGGLLGPALALPLAAPLLIACLHATEQALTIARPWGPSLTFAAGFTVAVGALAYIVASHVVEVA